MTIDQTRQPLDVAAVRARAEAATPGPWRVVEEHGRDIADEGWSQVTIQSEVGLRDEVAEVIDDERTDENAEFIAAARADVPALLDALAAANAEIARLYELRRAAAIWRAQFEKPADTKFPRMAALIEAVDKLTKETVR